MAGRGFYVNFKVPELDNVLKNIDKYNAKSRVGIENSVKKSTKAIKAGAVSRIHDVTGFLKKHTTDSFNTKNIVGAIKAKAPHSHLVEFGHKGKAPAPEHPFMRPAYEQEKPNLVRDITEAVKP